MTCARCSKRLKTGVPHVWSRFTRSAYCADLDACGRRAKRKVKA